MKYPLLILGLALCALTSRAEDDLDQMLNSSTEETQEAQKLDADTKAAQKDLDENKAKAEKIKTELQAIKDVTSEKRKKLLELSHARDAAALEVKELEQQRRQAEAELNQTKEDEKAFHEKHKKEAVELDAKKAKVQTEIDAMKQENARILRTLASPAPAAPAIAPVAARPTAAAKPAMDGEMVLTKDCKFYASPTKAPQVLGAKSKGTAVHKVAEGNNWIAFPFNDTQKGYMLKNCFTP